MSHDKLKIMKIKKKYLFVIVILASLPVVVLCSFSFSGVTAVKVKKVTEWVVEIKDGKETRYLNEVKEFDKGGNQLLLINYKKDGSVREKELCKYDNFGNKMEVIHFVELKEVKAKSEYDHRTYKYNANGKKIEESEFAMDGQLKGRTVFKYNADGRKIGEIEYDKDGKIMRQLVVTFNSQKLVVKRLTVNGSGETLSVKTYEYVYH
jgi:hypothetical protein